MGMRYFVAVALFTVACNAPALPIAGPDMVETAAAWCGQARRPCCNGMGCSDGLTCMSRGPESQCFTADTAHCGGAGEACCFVKEMPNEIPTWCLGGLSCVSGVCS